MFNSRGESSSLARVSDKIDSPVKALRFEQTGSLEHLKYVDAPIPSPREGEVLVRIKAAGINKSDTSNVMGFFPYTTLPRTPGRDFAGVVEEGPAHLLGKAVYGSGKELGFTRDGTHAEYLVLPADGVAIKPDALSFEAAAACGVPFVTAWYALETCHVKAGEKVVVLGAAGGVGVATIHLARMRGAEVLCAVRKPEQARTLEARGFRTMILSQDEALEKMVRRHFPDGADMIYDTAGPWAVQSVAALARFGRLALIVIPPRDGYVNMPLRDLYRHGRVIVGVNSLLYSSSECARMFQALQPGFESGQLLAPDSLTPRPLSQGREVYAALQGGASGKFVLVPG